MVVRAGRALSALDAYPATDDCAWRIASMVSNAAHIRGLLCRSAHEGARTATKPRNYEGHSKDYEFSRASMEEHWRAGYHDARRTLRHPEVLERPKNRENLFTFDLEHDSRE